ncbi:MAG: serine hydrolase domain-containing protein [Burkholderiales bacterium]
MLKNHMLWPALALAILSGCASQPAATGNGFSAEGLARLERTISADVDRGRIPGVVMMVQRDGQLLYSKTLGKQDPANGAPMREDSIFRIYSMTKPIVSVGLMMLVEEGRLMLSDPVSKHIPELKGLKVGVEKDGKLDVVAAQRQPTIQDLLRHTSGFTYGVFGKSMVKELYTKNGVDADDHSNAELAQKLAKVPLAYQPGTTWEYGRSTDVLGHVIERVSGQPLDAYLQARILGPLGMKDTAFYADAAKQPRLAEAFAKDPDSGAAINLLKVREPPKYLAGGQGLVSTAADYLRFAQMLLNGGELGGVRILSRKTVEYMSSDHLGAMRGPGPGYGFGLGFAVRHANGLSSTQGSAGDYNWAGYGGTYFWIDPKERLIAVWMMQAPNQRGYYRELYRNMIYSALN